MRYTVVEIIRWTLLYIFLKKNSFCYIETKILLADWNACHLIGKMAEKRLQMLSQKKKYQKICKPKQNPRLIKTLKSCPTEKFNQNKDSTKSVHVTHEYRLHEYATFNTPINKRKANATYKWAKHTHTHIKLDNILVQNGNVTNSKF